MQTYSTDWIENKTAQLIAAARASQFAGDIFADADQLRDARGYLPSVALGHACRYWLGDPITGELRLPPLT